MRIKTFGTLFRRELFSLALNPAAGVSGIFFTLVCFVHFFILRRFFVPLAGSTDMRYFFAPMPLLFVLCTPAVTMQSWTYFDLYDILPVSAVMRSGAKWLAAFVFFVFFVCITAAIPFAASFFGTTEFLVILTGFFGIICVLAMLIALGQCISFVFSSAPLSFFVSALVFLLFASVHRVPALFAFTGLPDSVFRFISFSRRFAAAGKGIIDSRDIVFFIVCTVFFLSLTAFIFENRAYSKRCKSRQKYALSIQYSVLFLLCALLLWNGSLFYFRADLTEKRIYSLSEASKRMLSVLQNRLTLSYYVSSELAAAQTGDITEFLYNYAEYSSGVSVRILRVKTAEQKRAAAAAGIYPHIIHTGTDSGLVPADGVQGENTEASVYSGIVLEYAQRRAIIPFVLTHTEAEFAIADTLPLFMQVPASSVQPAVPQEALTRRRVSLMLANDCDVQTDYPYLIPWLNAYGFAVDVIDPAVLENSSAEAVSALPRRQPLLLIGSSRLRAAHCEVLEDFLSSGGSMLCAVNAHTADLNTWTLTALSENPFLSLLKKYGIVTEKALVADTYSARIKMLRYNGTAQSGLESKLRAELNGSPEAFEEVLYPFFIQIRAKNTRHIHPLMQGFSGLDLFWPSLMHREDAEADKNNVSVGTETAAYTSVFSRPYFPFKNGENHYTADPFALSGIIPENAEALSGFPAVFAVQTPVDGRMVAVPDQYFLSRMVEYTGALYNFDFAVNALLWLSGEDTLLSIKNRAFDDYRVTGSDSPEFRWKARITLMLLFFWFFAAFSAFFITTAVQRRRFRKVCTYVCGKSVKKGI